MTKDDESKVLSELDYCLARSIEINYKSRSIIDEWVLKSITKFADYIAYLKTIINDYLIIICAKDTPGNFLKKDLMDLGLIDLSVNFQLSYIAVIDQGKVIFEKRSKDRLDVNDYISYEEIIDGINISAVSKGYLIGNVSQINIDGKDFSRNKRGLNFVVFDKKARKCLDSVGFDLHIPEKTAFRETKLSIENTLNLLGKSIQRSKELIETINKEQQNVFFRASKQPGQDIVEHKKQVFLSLPKNDELSEIHKGVLFLMRVIDDMCRKNNIDYWLGAGNLLGAVRHKGQIPWDDDFDVFMPREDFFRFCDIIDNKDIYPELFLNRYCWTHQDLYKGFFYRVELGDAAMTGRRHFVDIWPCSYMDNKNNEAMQTFWKIRQDFLEQKMGTLKYRWDILRKDYKAFNKQWREDVVEFEHIYDSFLCKSNNPQNLIFSITSNFSGLRDCETKNIFPLLDVDYDGIRLRVPNDPWPELNRYYGDIYYLPNDLVAHRHIKLDKENIKKMDDFIKKTKKEKGWD